MQLSENFTLDELTKSQTALRQGIDNTPEGEHLSALEALVQNVLQPIRDAIGVTVINSGYRSPALNEAVGGTGRSQHCKGQAVDIECPGTSNADLAQWIYDNLDFDQVILEFYTPGDPKSGWVHVSYKADGENRKSTLTALKEDGRTVYKQGSVSYTHLTLPTIYSV